MSDNWRSIDAALIRYRIERRMAGRRDLLLHLMVYLCVAVLFRLMVPWFTSPLDYVVLGGWWTIPLLLHGLRYYYRCGPGAAKRADEIERALDEQRERTALDADEECLIEDRISRRVTARRVLVTHAVASTAVLALYAPYILLGSDSGSWLVGHLTQLFSWFGLAFALHALRFFFVHGRSPFERALAVDAEIEREWRHSRERLRTRTGLFDLDDEPATLNLESIGARRLRLNAEGEFDNGDELAAGVSRR